MTPFVCTSLIAVQSQTVGNTSTVTAYTKRVMMVEPSIVCDLTAEGWTYPLLFGLALVSTIFYAVVVPAIFAISLYTNKEAITSDLRKREAGIDVEGKSVNMAGAALKHATYTITHQSRAPLHLLSIPWQHVASLTTDLAIYARSLVVCTRRSTLQGFDAIDSTVLVQALKDRTDHKLRVIQHHTSLGAIPHSSFCHVLGDNADPM